MTGHLSTRVDSLAGVSTNSQQFFPSVTVSQRDIQVYSNLSPTLKAAWRDAYEARSSQAPSIELHQLPARSLVSGRHGFALLVGDAMPLEQINPNAVIDLAAVRADIASARTDVQVNEEAVLIARYGEGTWGHWLVELLPKMALCEAFMPGRFKYVMASYVFDRDDIGGRIIESCKAFGVDIDRFIRIPNGETYSFDHLFAITPIFNDFTVHPAVTTLLIDHVDRHRPTASTPSTDRYLLHRTGQSRMIVNMAEIQIELQKRNFLPVEIASLSFLEQMSVFRSGRSVFSILGSGLSGVMFSPSDVNVIAAAPEFWGDRFFYGVLQSKEASQWAEVRGPVSEDHKEVARYSSFHLDPGVLNEALGCLGL